MKENRTLTATESGIHLPVELTEVVSFYRLFQELFNVGLDTG
jgi:hypothetical protein